MACEVCLALMDGSSVWSSPEESPARAAPVHLAKASGRVPALPDSNIDAGHSGRRAIADARNLNATNCALHQTRPPALAVGPAILQPVTVKLSVP